jgi:predicted HTH transcriptional regulator
MPENIDEWDLGIITNILQAGYYEDDTLEFKEKIAGENEKISRTSCAFANTSGGVIIFGISNDRTKPPLSRIIGLDKSTDNVLSITHQLHNIYPQIPSQNIHFGKQPIDLGGNKELILVRIIKSNILHSFENKFYRRLHGENNFIPYDEIKTKFIESRRNHRAFLLVSNELTLIQDSLNTVFGCKNDSDNLIV